MKRMAALLLMVALLLGGCVAWDGEPVAAIDDEGNTVATVPPAASPTPAPEAAETPEEGEEARGSSGAEKGAALSYSDRQPNVLVVGTRRPGAEPTPTPTHGLSFPESALAGEGTNIPYGSTTDVFQPGEIDPNKPMVALTFDDGPGKATGRILDILAQYGGRATFFVVGSVAEGKIDTLQRIAQEGHEIGNHTWSHKTLTGLSAQGVRDELSRTNELIYGAVGMRPAIMRPVGGSYNDSVLSIAGEMGMAVVNWSVDTVDWKIRDADSVYNATMKDVHDGGIVIYHDLYTTTADAIERIVPQLITQGYQLVTVSELLSAREGGMQPGVFYRHR